jgi:hypothetical protein
MVEAAAEVEQEDMRVTVEAAAVVEVLHLQFIYGTPVLKLKIPS